MKTTILALVIFFASFLLMPVTYQSLYRCNPEPGFTCLGLYSSTITESAVKVAFEFYKGDAETDPETALDLGRNAGLAGILTLISIVIINNRRHKLPKA